MKEGVIYKKKPSDKKKSDNKIILSATICQ